MQKDFRSGTPSSIRVLEAQRAIRESLKLGERSFSQLLKETGLSRSALASHLKDLYKKGEIGRTKNSEDFRITYYSLTSKGKSSLGKEEIYHYIINSTDEQLLEGISTEILFEIEIAKEILRLGVDDFESEYLKTPALAFLLKRLGIQSDVNIKKDKKEALKMIMLNALERFNKAFSFRIYSPIPLKEDRELDEELYIIALWLMIRAQTKLSIAGPQDINKLLRSEHARIIINIQLNMKEYA